ncbi:MAG: hypothetical protein K9K65_06915 [Desulfarculaceae bacterium]|nr:hypothetical protein [Desulfarculaceae bacterium]MCF8049394.1 hypothetical protein [Desulfarculaceae bacterium]MCF8064575.1 hypothetical protein [Desulfarculaceae bacterium]MCF8097558.1 hypothetical protein [Desulfarculaceae bacterium]MCF8123362.1 hypothetical protein [Desulfarculaceae bacterium]
MIGKKAILGALALVLLLALAIPVQAGPAHIHFLVVPPNPAAGLNNLQAMEGFRNALAETAGGYTEWGPSQGASREGGKLKRQTNFSYLVAADRDLTGDLVKLIQKYFTAPRPFVLHWTGTASIPLGK